MRARIGSAVIVVILSIFGVDAYADCEFDGRSYPEGSTYGSYICEDGTWKEEE